MHILLHLLNPDARARYYGKQDVHSYMATCTSYKLCSIQLIGIPMFTCELSMNVVIEGLADHHSGTDFLNLKGYSPTASYRVKLKVNKSL